MRKSQRQSRGEGMDLGGSQMRRRFEEIEAAAQDAKQASRGTMRGSEPQKDTEATGSSVANALWASDAGFKVYTEKSGGRRGMKGKRGAPD